MKQPDPLVSIVCATRNRPKLVERAVQSIREQSYQSYEVLVLDDGSDPPTFAEYERVWKNLDHRFVLHQIRPAGSKGAGPSHARNQGIPRSNGRYVTFLDDDDSWCRPDHLEVAVGAMERSSADYYFANMHGIREDQIVIPDYYPNAPQLTRGRLVTEHPPVHEVSLADFVRTMNHHLVHPDVAIIRRDLLLAVGGFFERVIYGEDYDLMMRIADRATRILFRPECVAKYRLPVGDSISSAEGHQDQTLQRISCAQHVRAKCTNPLVRKSARAREAWSMREMSDSLLAEGRTSAAMSFAWQAICTYPTIGAAVFLCKQALRAPTAVRPANTQAGLKASDVR